MQIALETTNSGLRAPASICQLITNPLPNDFCIKKMLWIVGLIERNLSKTCLTMKFLYRTLGKIPCFCELVAEERRGTGTDLHIFLAG